MSTLHPGEDVLLMIVGEMYSLKVSEATGSMYLVSRVSLAGEAEAGAAVASGEATISTISSNPGAGAIPLALHLDHAAQDHLPPGS